MKREVRYSGQYSEKRFQKGYRQQGGAAFFLHTHHVRKKGRDVDERPHLSRGKKERGERNAKALPLCMADLQRTKISHQPEEGVKYLYILSWEKRRLGGSLSTRGGKKEGRR